MNGDGFDQALQGLSGMSVDRALELGRKLVSDPMGNLPTTLLSITVLMLVLLAVTLLLLYMLMPSQRKIVRTRTYAQGRPDAADETGAEGSARLSSTDARASRRPGRVAAFLGSWIGISLILLAGIAAIYGVTSTNRYCYSFCHARSASVSEATKIDHATCVQCHEARGLAGVVDNTVSRTRMVVLALAGRQADDVTTPVQSTECLACHSDLLHKTITTEAGVRVAHEHIVASGRPCSSCHPNPGHVETTYSLGMSQCTPCHDGTTASAACATCHVTSTRALGGKGTGAKSSVTTAGPTAQDLSGGGFIYTPIHAAKPTCDGCHDVAKECDPCHGVRMPHDDAFIEGGHAAVSAFEQKQKCWKCHTPETDCGRPCHSGFKRSGITGHPPTWKTEHQVESGPGTCGCHQWYSGRTGPMCPLCHKERR